VGLLPGRLGAARFTQGLRRPVATSAPAPPAWSRWTIAGSIAAAVRDLRGDLEWHHRRSAATAAGNRVLPSIARRVGRWESSSRNAQNRGSAVLSNNRRD